MPPCLLHSWLRLLLPVLLSPLATAAQEMAVKSMALVENDMTANMEENLRKDLNGNYDFSIGETEVTQALWQAVMGRQNGSTPQEEASFRSITNTLGATPAAMWLGCGKTVGTNLLAGSGITKSQPTTTASLTL